MATCKTCKGKGSVKCPPCNGRGRIVSLFYLEKEDIVPGVVGIGAPSDCVKVFFHGEILRVYRNA